MAKKNWADKLEDELEEYYKNIVDDVVEIMEKHIPKNMTDFGIQWRTANHVTESAVMNLDYETWYKFNRRCEDAKEGGDNGKD